MRTFLLKNEDAIFFFCIGVVVFCVLSAFVFAEFQKEISQEVVKVFTYVWVFSFIVGCFIPFAVLHVNEHTKEKK